MDRRAHGPGDNGWANATFFSGLLALQRLTGSPRYLAYARNWAEKHAYGLNGGVTTRHADHHNAGQAYLDLYEIEPEESKISAIEESLHRMVYTDQPRTTTGGGTTPCTWRCLRSPGSECSWW